MHPYKHIVYKACGINIIMVVGCNFYYKLHNGILTKISNSYNRRIFNKHLNHQLFYAKGECLFPEMQIFELLYELQNSIFQSVSFATFIVFDQFHTEILYW